ncbi:L-rhamnose mutarotase [Agromyces aureus]|uniref:L-rhamnose mutarotase n=1 Tax=Agromyces aureus TaxID=453304 RepID=UPI000A038E2C|nr:L-rhamnose mutarotase [Agromyces aureus]
MTSQRDAAERVCFQLQVDPARLDEYRERHAAVWPEMLRAIADSGRRNYSLYLRADGLLIGVYESDDDAASQRALENDPRTAAWEAEMAEFFVSLDGSRPDQGAPRLAEVFNLEDQLAALDAEPAASVADAGHPASVAPQTPTDHAASVAPIAESSNS